jgi:hypothetical protein
MIQTALLSSSGTSARAEHPGAGGVVLGRRLAADSWPTYAIVKRPWVTDTLDRVGAQPVAMATDLLGSSCCRAGSTVNMLIRVTTGADTEIVDSTDTGPPVAWVAHHDTTGDCPPTLPPRPLVTLAVEAPRPRVGGVSRG